MERKVSRRGLNSEHLPLDKSMIGAPTNFSHVGRSDPFRDRVGEWVEGEARVGGQAGVGAKEQRWAEASEDGQERRDAGEEGERQGGEFDSSPLSPTSLSPPSPNTERRNSRRISKDMISLPMNFRHVLHIDPSSADPAHLSLLLKSGTELEYDLECDEEEEEEEEEENDDSSWPPPEPPIDYPDGPKGAPDPAPPKPKPHRPSNRVRKSMISLPTNFQHVNHISAGERLHGPESPPPQVPPEPQPDEEGGETHEAGWGYENSSTTHTTHPLPSSPPHFTPHTVPNHTVNPYFSSNAANPPTPPSPTYVNVPLPTTHHPHLPPPLTMPEGHAPHSPGPLSAPPQLGTPRAKGHVTVSGPDQDPDRVRIRGADSDFDFDVVQFRVPPPPPIEFTGDDVRRCSLPPRPRTHHQHLMEESRREGRNDSMEEEEREEEEGSWRRNEQKLTLRDRCQEEARRPPLEAPPPPPAAPPSAARRRSIGRPTNFQHVRHLDAETAELLLEECAEEISARNGEKRRGRERESGRARERRTPSLPPALPHSPRAQDPQPSAKLRKPVIGHPTNFQHVAHVGFGGVHGVH